MHEIPACHNSTVMCFSWWEVKSPEYILVTTYIMHVHVYTASYSYVGKLTKCLGNSCMTVANCS